MWPGSSHGKGHRVEDILGHAQICPAVDVLKMTHKGAAGGADLRSVTMPRSRADWGGVMEQPSISSCDVYIQRTATKQNGHKVTTKRYQNHIHLQMTSLLVIRLL